MKMSFYNSHPMSSDIFPLGEAAPTLTSKYAKGSADGVLVMDEDRAKAYLIRMRSGKPGGGKGALIQIERSGTLACGNDQTLIDMRKIYDNHAQDCRCNEMDIAPTLAGKMGTGGNNVPLTTEEIDMRGVVRRLTTIECERLQGFPDDYTRIPYKGKTPDKCPEAPRYKAIGNSWAVPCVRWIGERIQKEINK